MVNAISLGLQSSFALAQVQPCCQGNPFSEVTVKNQSAAAVFLNDGGRRASYEGYFGGRGESGLEMETSMELL